MWEMRERNGAHLVYGLQSGIVLESLEGCTVALPEKLEPGGDECSIGAILALISADCAEKDGLWCFAGLEIVHVDRDGFVGLFLCLVDLGVCECEEFLDDDLDGGNICVLCDVLVLHEALLCSPALAHVDAELDEANKDGLEGGEGRRPEALR